MKIANELNSNSYTYMNLENQYSRSLPPEANKEYQSNKVQYINTQLKKIIVVLEIKKNDKTLSNRYKGGIT